MVEKRRGSYIEPYFEDEPLSELGWSIEDKVKPQCSKYSE